MNSRFVSSFLTGLFVVSVSQAADLSNTVLSVSGNVNQIEISLDKDLATCASTINAVLKALNSANKIIVAAPLMSSCNGQTQSSVVKFF